MGKQRIGMSDFGQQVSEAIRAGMGVRRLSGRALGSQINRSYSYVQARVNDEKEWALSDIERICNAWGITPDQLLNQHRFALPHCLSQQFDLPHS